jgi:hypothetical protein
MIRGDVHDRVECYVAAIYLRRKRRSIFSGVQEYLPNGVGYIFAVFHIIAHMNVFQVQYQQCCE